MLAGHPGERTTPDMRDVLNYNAALDLANAAALRPDFEWSQELLRRLNAVILAGLPDDERGEYRTGAVTVGGVFAPPDAYRLPALMRELVDWLQSDDLRQHTLVRAGLAHLNVVSIHPWTNGNGRTARVAGSLALMRRGVSAPELVNIESWIRSHPDAYAAVLQETHGPDYRPDEHSATAWLEYFATISVDRLDLRNRLLVAAQADIGALVIALSERAQPTTWAPILLAARIRPLHTSAIAGPLGLSAPRVRSILAAIVQAGWLVPVGERRGRALRGRRSSGGPRPAITGPHGSTSRRLLSRYGALGASWASPWHVVGDHRPTWLGLRRVLGGRELIRVDRRHAVVDVVDRVALADHRLGEQRAVGQEHVGQEPVVAVALVLGRVGLEEDRVAGLEQALGRRGGLAGEALDRGAGLVGLGAVEADDPDVLVDAVRAARGSCRRRRRGSPSPASPSEMAAAVGDGVCVLVAVGDGLESARVAEARGGVAAEHAPTATVAAMANPLNRTAPRTIDGIMRAASASSGVACYEASGVEGRSAGSTNW